MAGHQLAGEVSTDERQTKPRFTALRPGTTACALLVLIAWSTNLLQTRTGPSDGLVSEVHPWPQADVLFHQDTRWLGADGASSIDLGNGNTLWLFGDTFVGTSPGEVRWQSTLVRNTIAIQEGDDPSRARMTFAWRSQEGRPASFFPDTDTSWYWPGHGIRLDSTLIVFLMKIHRAEGGLGFYAFGWTAVVIRQPDRDPLSWKVEAASTAEDAWGVIIGSATVMRMGDYVYAFGAEEPAVHNIFIVRWPLDAARRGDLSEPAWWSSADSAWIVQTRLQRKPVPLFTGGATEFSVHRVPETGTFIQVQPIGFGAATFGYRTAPRITGPWSELTEFYRPPEMHRPDIMIYALKLHPHLRGDGLIATYATNTFSLSELVTDQSLYYPRVLRLRLTSSR